MELEASSIKLLKPEGAIIAVAYGEPTESVGRVARG